ncbi:unnamed protein product [Lampetra fluviatilis]
MAQLETWKIVLAKPCELTTPTTAVGKADGGLQADALPALPAPSATWHEDAILGVAGEKRREAAILSSPRRGDAAIFNIAAERQPCAAIWRCRGESSLL